MNVATINIKFLSKFGEGLVYIPYKNWKTCPKQNWLKIGYYSWRYFHLKSHEIDLWDLLNILSFEIVFKKNFVKSICASWRARASFLSLKLFLRKFYEIDFYATFCCEFDFTEKFVKSIFSNARMLFYYSKFQCEMNSFMNQFWIVCKLISRKNCRKDKSKLLRLLSQQSALHIYCFCSYSLSLTSLLHRSYGVVLMTILDFFSPFLPT